MREVKIYFNKKTFTNTWAHNTLCSNFSSLINAGLSLFSSTISGFSFFTHTALYFFTHARRLFFFTQHTSLYFLHEAQYHSYHSKLKALRHL